MKGIDIIGDCCLTGLIALYLYDLDGCIFLVVSHKLMTCKRCSFECDM